MNGTNSGSEGKINWQPETPAEMKTVELRTAVEIKETIDAIGGHNLLDEHGSFAGEPGRHDEWLQDVTSKTIDNGGAALAIQEGDTLVGFILSDREGNISQFRSTQGKEVGVIQEAIKKLNDKSIERPKVRMTKDSERARRAFRDAGFLEKERTDAEIVMEKH
jgi:hypothetical protein